MSTRIFTVGFFLMGSAFLAGCQSGGSASSGQAAGPAQGAAIRESEIGAFCPPVTLLEGTASLRRYERGAEGDGDRVIYQASISETTRTCQYDRGAVTVAVAGKVVPGPRGQAGTITLPIRVAALRGDDVIYSQLFRHPVTVTDTSGATQFIFSDPNIVIPGGIGQTVRILIGFDEGTN